MWVCQVLGCAYSMGFLCTVVFNVSQQSTVRMCACAYGVALICLVTLLFRVSFVLRSPSKTLNIKYKQGTSHQAL